jgi:hypothetical protein
VVAYTPAGRDAEFDVPDYPDTADMNVLLKAFADTAAGRTDGVVKCTNATRPSTPLDGQLIYETDTKRPYLWNGTTWRAISMVALSETLLNKTLTSPTINDATINDGTIDTPAISSPTFSGTMSGSLTGGSLFDLLARSPREQLNVVAASVPATCNIDTDTSATAYYTVASAADFTVNIRKSAGATLNSLMATGEAIQVSLLVTNTTARSLTAITVDGAAATVKWMYGSALPAGDASAVDLFTFVVVKTAGATFHVFASMTKYA